LLLAQASKQVGDVERFDDKRHRALVILPHNQRRCKKVIEEAYGTRQFITVVVERELASIPAFRMFFIRWDNAGFRAVLRWPMLAKKKCLGKRQKIVGY